MQELARTSIALFGMITVQADSCLNSEQIDTLFISVGGQEGEFGTRGSFWAGGPKLTRDCQGSFLVYIYGVSTME